MPLICKLEVVSVSASYEVVVCAPLCTCASGARARRGVAHALPRQGEVRQSGGHPHAEGSEVGDAGGQIGRRTRDFLARLGQ